MNSATIARIDPTVARYLHQIVLPQKDSHKGENGKLLLIGGSELFHAASAWSLEVAARIADMVFYSSVPDNNVLIHEAKKGFWNGVVVPREQVTDYIDEADCVLIGPGMTRDSETERITNDLLRRYPRKRWVVDAGALQMADPKLLGPSIIVTPHHQEFERLFGRRATRMNAIEAGQSNHGVTILLKGREDIVVSGSNVLEISGGNEGMTKGGTGDVLAGLVAGLYCKSDAFASAVVGSYINKRAGDELYEMVGPFYSASDLADQIPKTMKALLISA